MGRGVFASAFVAAVLALAGTAAGSPQALHTSLVANLKGSAETPRKGPARGSGTAVITLHRATDKVCWKLSVRGLDKTLSAHIHKARPGKIGPVVVPLGSVFAPRGCVRVPRKTLIAVGTNPSAYYVNVHTKKYIDGAIRGQLKIR